MPDTAAALIATPGTAAPTTPAAAAPTTPSSSTTPTAAPPTAGTTTTAPTAPPADAWYKDLPADVHPLSAKYKDVAAAMAGFANAQKFIGKDPSRLVEIPATGDATGQRALWTRLGCPEKADGYKLDGELAKDPTVGAAREAAFAAGLSQDQFAALAGWLDTSGKAAREAADTTFATNAAQAVAELRTQWGAGFDKQMQGVRAVSQRLGFTGDELDAIERAIGTKPLLERLAKAGERMTEPTAPGGAPNGSQAAGMTPEQAGAELRALGKDKAFQKRLQENDAEAHKRVKELTAYRAGMTPDTFAGMIGAGRGGERVSRV